MYVAYRRVHVHIFVSIVASRYFLVINTCLLFGINYTFELNVIVIHPLLNACLVFRIGILIV